MRKSALVRSEVCAQEEYTMLESENNISYSRNYKVVDESMYLMGDSVGTVTGGSVGGKGLGGKGLGG